jgi:hypothetical protein
MKTKHQTREQWLHAGLELIRPLFGAISNPAPKKIRVSCGFPSRNALGNRLRAIGECWSDKASKGSYFEIFVSPILNEPVKVLDVLTHEVVHAVVGLECGHKKPFKLVATAVGLEGPMKSTKAGAALQAKLEGIAKQLGPYPHDELSKMTSGKKPDKCRMFKCSCPDCGYTVRITKKWLEVSPPACPNPDCESNGEPMEGEE